ncbi:unnamed protein product [Rhizoctonia solani]|uniref:NADH-cytochrome b5 reductase n=1 Tax=Rhizoctonia solani TaxID=456999 RepID=A0A8H3BGQ3_9AGAM|nr:unnamed protein product [Rhizoctonia solani]
MPNTPQALFAGSFVGTISALVLLARTLGLPPFASSEEHTIQEPKNQFARSLVAVSNAMGIDSTQLLAMGVGAAATCAALYFIGSKKRTPILDPKEWKEFPLIEKIEVSPNTAIYRFGLPDPNDILGLPIGQHISVQAEINGKDIMRSYTPTSSDDDRGHFDLLVKTYEKGNISRYLSLLKIGDKVRVKGPKGQFNYHPSLSRELGMIAGGTGITPMLQIIRAAMKNPLDLTKISLIYANVSKEDILLKAELDDLAARYPSRFSVYYVLNNVPEGWDGGIGFVTKDMVEKHMPPTDSNIKILLCGPPPMMTAMKKHLDDLGYPAPRTVSKLVDQVFLF